jgi:hypothetical protein
MLVGVGITTGSGITPRLPMEGRAVADPYVGLSAVACGLVVLIVGLAVVPPPQASLSKGSPDSGAYPNPTWAGYETASPVRSVAASWTEPAVAESALGVSEVSFWVGLQGQSTARVAQIGTDAYDQAGRPPVYTAWYEMYPKPSVNLDTNLLSMHPGDRVSASVAETSPGHFRLVIVNHTTHQRYSLLRTDLGIPDSRGAIVAELPTASYTPSLAAFGSVQFTDCDINGQALAGFPVTMLEIFRRGATQARTSALGRDGGSFTVDRQ